MAGLKEDVAGLKEDVAGLKEDVAGLKEDVAGLKEDVAEIKESIRIIPDIAERLHRLQEMFQQQFRIGRERQHMHMEEFMR